MSRRIRKELGLFISSVIMTNETKPLEETDIANLAARFVNSTGRHVFLTGKAGTGKTTFLQNIAKATHKKHLIVAPTGIAALNAGGVTIHSQFLLPLGSYVPNSAGVSEQGHSRFFDAKTLTIRHPLNSVRKQVLRNIELLIIDEVSMLRADILDAIDERLRAARRIRNKPFGGVQLLLIGDLFQLPPIVKDHEWQVLRKFYKSMHFFSSQALQQHGYAYLELSKVFRQSDDVFINLLNNLRNNACTTADIDLLNSHYKPNTEDLSNIITLTTHNRQADEINQKALDELPDKAFNYTTKVTGDFPESMYPLPAELTFKVGAQVMFVKNDNVQNNFYNGKLAKIIDLGKNHIEVKMSGEERNLVIEPMLWQNVKYSVDDKKDLIEDIVGKFEQYPIRLAWAVTVHKSQGLTFDRAVIDVGRAFAPGQVYVALSRLRSLDGLVLRTKISQSAISTDGEVMNFQKSRDLQADLSETLRQGQAEYLRDNLHKAFDFNVISEQLGYIKYKLGDKMEFADADMREALPNLKEQFDAERENTRKFRNQLSILLQDGDFDKLRTRIEKGSLYYSEILYKALYNLLLHKHEAALFAKSKGYVNMLAEIDQLIMMALSKLQQAHPLLESILDQTDDLNTEELLRKRNAKREAYLAKIEAHIKANPRKGASKTGKRKKKGPTEKGATYQETYMLIKEGLDVRQIAVKRSLTESTIESHVARGISEGKVKLSKFMKPDDVATISEKFNSETEAQLSDVFASFKGKYTYGQLRMVRCELQRLAEADSEKE